jgi:D-arabinonate dehydratase
MTIKSARVHYYEAPYDEPITNGLYTYTHTRIVICELETQSGVVGVGWTHGGSIVYEALKEIAEVVIGQPLNTERIWKLIYRPKLFGRRGLATRAISAVDIAVWDAIGKETGRSVHQLLGGCRESVPTYVAGGYYGRTKGMDGLQNEVAQKVGIGAKALKMKIGAVSIKEDIARIDAVMEAVGPGVDVLVDANNAYNRIDALKMARLLEERGIYWFEEPLSPEDNAGAADLVQRTDIPVALGENEYTITGFRELIDARAADVLNADAQILGGITEWQKCAHYADAHHIPVAPHGDQEIHVHLVAAVPNGLIVEYYDNGVNTLKDAMFKEPLQINADGTVTPPSRPGLGVDLNYAALQRFRVS